MVSPLQPSSARGEITPLAGARVDTAAYQISLALCANWVVTPYGSLTRRPGTIYVNSTKADGEARLIPFQFSTTEAYILEFGEGHMRVFRQRSQVGDGGGGAYEIPSPYTLEQVKELQFTQSADVLYLAHKDVAPHKLERTADDAWTFTEIGFTAKPAEWVADNYPQRVGFFEDRLAWAATPNEPQTIWLSKTGDFENHTGGTADDDALNITISAGQVNAIQWLAEDQALLIGTTGATRTLSGAGIDEPLTPTSIKQKRQSSDGSAAIQPVQTGETTLYAGRFGEKLRELVYSLDNNRFVSPDQSILAEHLLLSNIKAMAYQKAPYGIVWCQVGDGRLIGFTYLPAQQVYAFHQHPIAGGANDADGRGVVESVATIPGENQDEVWCIVRRTINNQTVRYVEYMDEFRRYTAPDKADIAHHVDAGLVYTGPEAGTFTQLNHLENETVGIWGNRAVLPGERVRNGAITLRNGRTISNGQGHFGLGFQSLARTLRLDVGVPDGSATGRQRRVNKINIDVLDALEVYVAEAVDDPLRPWNPVFGRDPDAPMDVGPPLVTGAFEVNYDGSWNKEGQVYLIAATTAPATIRSWSAQMRVER